MSSKVKYISRNVTLESQYLDENIVSHLFEKCKATFTGTSTTEDGYIVKITNLSRVLGNTISSASSANIFQVVLEAEVFSPKEGEEYEGVINKILPAGIFVHLCDKIKVLIPETQLPFYNFSFADGSAVASFVLEAGKGARNVKVDDRVNVRIISVRNSKGSLVCIAKIIT